MNHINMEVMSLLDFVHELRRLKWLKPHAIISKLILYRNPELSNCNIPTHLPKKLKKINLIYPRKFYSVQMIPSQVFLVRLLFLLPYYTDKYTKFSWTESLSIYDSKVHLEWKHMEVLLRIFASVCSCSLSKYFSGLTVSFLYGN